MFDLTTLGNVQMGYYKMLWKWNVDYDNDNSNSYGNGNNSEIKYYDKILTLLDVDS